MFFRQKKRPSFPDPSFRSSQSDGFRSSLLPLPLSLSLLHAENGCSHAKMTAEAPIELVEARPPVAFPEGGCESLESGFYK